MILSQLCILILLAHLGHSQRRDNLVVTTFLNVPYMSLREDWQSKSLTENDRYEGFLVDLLHELSRKLDFDFTIKEVDDGFYGLRDTQGQWNGMIGEVMTGRAQIAVADLTITRAREEVVDFTYPFMTGGITILHKAAEASEKVDEDFKIGVLVPFMYVSTDIVLALAIILGVVVFLLRKNHKKLYFRGLLGLLFAILFFFAALYIAQLSAFYSSSEDVNDKSDQVTKLESLHDLINQDSISYGTVNSGSTRAFFTKSNLTIYAAISKKMDSDPNAYVTSYKEGLDRVKQGGYAFFMESMTLDYVLNRECELYQVGGLLDSKGYGLAVRDGSPWREKLSLAIIELQESGFMPTLKHKWWMLNNDGDCKRKI